MFRAFQGVQWRGGVRGLHTLVLLCVGLLMAVGTAQASHVHDAGALGYGSRTDAQGHGQRAVLMAPAQDCAWCAATQAALPAHESMVTVPMPRVADVRPAVRVWRACEQWDAEMFGRPPPAGCADRKSGQADAGVSGAIVRTMAV